MENTSYDDGMKIKDLILTIHKYTKEIFRNWILIAIISIPFILILGIKAFKTKPQYVAEIRFIVEGEGGSSGGGLGGLLGSLGIGRSGNSNPFKILEVAKSRRIIESTLLSKQIDGSLIINEIIRNYELDKKWEESMKDLSGYQFQQTPIDSLEGNGRIAFISCLNRTIGTSVDRSNALLKFSLDDEKDIFSFSSKTASENLSLGLVENSYEFVKKIFEEELLEVQKNTRDIFLHKSDSLKRLIDYKSLQLARFEDQNRGVYLREKLLKKDKLYLEVQGLTSAFVETTKNFEFADLNYKNIKPLFLIIDNPIRPLLPKKPSLILNLLVGAFIGLLFGTLFVILRKIYRDIMS